MVSQILCQLGLAALLRRGLEEPSLFTTPPSGTHPEPSVRERGEEILEELENQTEKQRMVYSATNEKLTGLLMINFSTTQNDWNATTVNHHAISKFNVIVTPPAIIDFIVSTNSLPDLTREGSVHTVKVSTREHIVGNVLKYFAVAEAVVTRLEVVGLRQDALEVLRAKLGRRFCCQDLIVLEGLGVNKVTLSSYNVWSGRIPRGQELVQVLQGVLVEDNIRVHSKDVVILGFQDSHVTSTRNAESVFQLAPLD